MKKRKPKKKKSKKGKSKGAKSSKKKWNEFDIIMMKRSGTKAKYSPMEQSSVYQVQFTTISEDLLV